MGFDVFRGPPRRELRPQHVPRFVITNGARYWAGRGWSANLADADQWLVLGECEAYVRRTWGPHGILPGGGTVGIRDIAEGSHVPYGSN